MDEDRDISVPDEVELATDQWMRFDLWSARAWEATQYAVKIISESGHYDGPLDNRAVASFCAAQTAQEFATMVNPMASPSGATVSTLSDAQAQAILAMVLDDED